MFLFAIDNITIVNKVFSYSKNLISAQETQKLKDIRDSYTVISGLEKLYTNKTQVELNIDIYCFV